MRLSAFVLLACCAALAVAVRVDLAKKPTTSMGKAFQSIDNNLVGLINCAARRSQRSQASSFIEETPCATAQVPAQSAATTVVAVANAPQTVIPVIESAPAIESQKCAQKAQQAAASSAASDVTARELAEYFESVNGGSAIKGDDIMKLCKHAGGPFAGVFRKIRKAATGLAAAIEGLLPLFKAKDHDQAEDSEAPAAAAIATAVAGAAVAPTPAATPAAAAAPAAAAPAPTAGAAPAPAASLLEVSSSQPMAASTRRKIRFDREHKPISEAVCDFLVRHVNDLADVCPDAARDEDGSKVVTGLIGHALAVALRG